jgi:hypothetical protein
MQSKFMSQIVQVYYLVNWKTASLFLSKNEISVIYFNLVSNVSYLRYLLLLVKSIGLHSLPFLRGVGVDRKGRSIKKKLFCGNCWLQTIPLYIVLCPILKNSAFSQTCVGWGVNCCKSIILHPFLMPLITIS